MEGIANWQFPLSRWRKNKSGWNEVFVLWWLIYALQHSYCYKLFHGYSLYLFYFGCVHTFCLLICNLYNYIDHRYGLFSYSNYNKYSSVKDKLFIRVCKADELSKEKLPENVPYHIRDDFLITCYIYCNDSPEYSVLVDDRLLLLYGISQDQLFYDVAANSESLFPFSVHGILEQWTGRYRTILL